MNAVTPESKVSKRELRFSPVYDEDERRQNRRASDFPQRSGAVGKQFFPFLFAA